MRHEHQYGVDIDRREARRQRQDPEEYTETPKDFCLHCGLSRDGSVSDTPAGRRIAREYKEGIEYKR